MGQVQRRARLKRELQGQARMKVRRLACPFMVMSVGLEIAGEAAARAVRAIGGLVRGIERAREKKVLDEMSLS